MFCKHCGTQLENGAQFCFQCGMRIEATSNEQEVPLSAPTEALFTDAPPAAQPQWTPPAEPVYRSEPSKVVDQYPTPAPAKKGLKGWAIALIVAGVVAVLAAGGVLAWMFLFNNQEDVGGEPVENRAVVTPTRGTRPTTTTTTTMPTTTTTQTTTTTTTRPTTTTTKSSPVVSFSLYLKGVTTDALNVRRDPSTRYDRVGLLKKGSSVVIIGESGDWWEIEYSWKADGQSGYSAYVHKDYVSVETTTTRAAQASTADYEYFLINNNNEVKITKYIGKGGDVSIPSIIAGRSVREIADSAFAGCTSVYTVTIPEGVTSIGEWAFWDCSSLSSITIPQSLSIIGDHAFSGCSALRYVFHYGDQRAQSYLSIGSDNDALSSATWTS